MKQFNQFLFSVMFYLFLFSVILGGIGASILVIHIDFDPPAETDLVRVTGDVDTIVIADDIADPENKFNTALPLDSIYIKLKGAPQEYRYRGSWLNFEHVYKVSVASNVDIWIDARQLGTEDPLYIYQIVERNPFRDVAEVLHVSRLDSLWETYPTREQAISAAIGACHGK